ncbi:ATP-binding protein [Jatrophihabitans sp. YIM 134969]
MAPVELTVGRWYFAVDIPWLPDLLADESNSLTGRPLVEAFGRQVGMLRAISMAARPGSAFQLRFVSGGDNPAGVVCHIVGASRSVRDAVHAGALLCAAIPPEFPAVPVPAAEVAARVRPFASDPDATGLAEIRRTVEPLAPFVEDQSLSDPVLLPWSWSAHALLSSVDLLRRHAGTTMLAVHVEPRPTTPEALEWLQEEFATLVTHLRDVEESPILATALRAYNGWLRDLPRSSVHLRVMLASDVPLAPGVPQMVGGDLSRTWEDSGPRAVAGNFDVCVPASETDIDSCLVLLEELVSDPFQTPESAELRELLFQFTPSDATVAFRLPVAPRGGLDGVATGTRGTLGRGRTWSPRRDGVTSVTIGNRPDGGAVDLELSELNRHVLLAGLPGFGKTTTMHALLDQLSDLDVPWLVIDPAKSDYRALIELGRKRGRGGRVYRLGPDHPAFNPLAPPEGVAPAAFAPRVLAAFDAVLGLSSAWPYGYMLLGQALMSTYDEQPDGASPTLGDLYRNVIVELQGRGQSERTRMDAEASLVGRLEYLAAGTMGRALLGDRNAGIDVAGLMAENTVIELGAFATSEQRALMFSLVMANVLAWRDVNRVPDRLAHVTVLEEAHRLLPPDGSNAGVNAFVEALAEVRGAGEGLVVIDQAPTMLHPGVAKLTSSILSHRVIQAAEREALGNAMVLHPRQHDELARLGPGRLIAFTANAPAAELADVTARTDTSFPTTLEPEPSLMPSTSVLPACVQCHVPSCVGDSGRSYAGHLLQAAAAASLEVPADPSELAGLVDTVLDDPAVSYCASAHVLAGRNGQTLTSLRRDLRQARTTLARDTPKPRRNPRP